MRRSPLISRRQLSCMILLRRRFLRVNLSLPNRIVSSRNNLKPRDESAFTTAESRRRPFGTTPAIRGSGHLHPCSFQDLNCMAIGRSAVNSLTFAHSSRATTASLSHVMRIWPVSSFALHKRCKGAPATPCEWLSAATIAWFALWGDDHLLHAAFPFVRGHGGA